MKTIWNKFKQWVLPFVLAVLAIHAVRKSVSAGRKEDRAKVRRYADTQDFLNERETDVVKSYERHRKAQRKSKEAKANAQKRVQQLGESDNSLSDLLDQYRRDRGLQHSSDAT
jgi:hypothetical protein